MIHDPLQVFISADFGQPVTLHLDGGDRCIIGIFDDGYFDQELGAVVMDTTRKTLTVNYTDIVGLKREHEITFIDQRYSVTRIEPEGTGLAMVHLSKET